MLDTQVYECMHMRTAVPHSPAPHLNNSSLISALLADRATPAQSPTIAPVAAAPALHVLRFFPDRIPDFLSFRTYNAMRAQPAEYGRTLDAGVGAGLRCDFTDLSLTLTSHCCSSGSVARSAFVCSPHRCFSSALFVCGRAVGPSRACTRAQIAPAPPSSPSPAQCKPGPCLHPPLLAMTM